MPRPNAPRARWVRRALGLGLGVLLAFGGAGLASPALATAAPLDPQPSAVEGLGDPAADVQTTTRLSIALSPTRFGEFLIATATVELDGPANLSGKELVLESDGVVVGRSMLIYIGSGRFSTLIPFVSELPAGTHRLVARFNGSPSGGPGVPGALPSESVPIELTVAQLESTTVITSAPHAGAAFDPIDVTAKVGVGSRELDGEASLLADGATVMTSEVDSDGTVSFDDAVLPVGTTGLAVAFLGDPAGNYAPSTSATAPFAMESLATSTELKLSADRTRADVPATASATVRTTDPAARKDPRGSVEFRIDGAPFASDAVLGDSDPAVDDGTARFDVELSGLPTGEHEITAHFVPEAGFVESASDAAQLQVLGIETVLVPAARDLRATPTTPAVVEVAVSATAIEAEAEAEAETGSDSEAGTDAGTGSESSEPEGPLSENAHGEKGAAAFGAGIVAPSVEGQIQVYVAGEPHGEPFAVSAGAGSGTIAGLPAGVHEAELRFVPAEQPLLPSSASVTVRVTADAVPDGGEGDGGGDGGDSKPTPDVPSRGDGGEAKRNAAAPATLSVTGAAGSAPLVVGGLALILSAAGVLLVARRAARG